MRTAASAGPDDRTAGQKTARAARMGRIARNTGASSGQDRSGVTRPDGPSGRAARVQIRLGGGRAAVVVVVVLGDGDGDADHHDAADDPPGLVVLHVLA